MSKFSSTGKIVLSRTHSVAPTSTPTSSAPASAPAAAPALASVPASILFRTAKDKVKLKLKKCGTDIRLQLPVPLQVPPQPPLDSHELIKPQRIKLTTRDVPLMVEEPSASQELNLWAEKYRPATLNNLVGNKEQISLIRDWFGQFQKKDNTIKKALLFSGCPGTSKTTVAHVILREFGYDVKEYNASDVRSKKLVEENLNKLITMEQVDKHFRDNFKPFGIIMDEVDGMSAGDKGGMTQLIKTINPNRGKRCVKKLEKQKIGDRWIPPIICICNNNYDKKINELKKDCLEIKFDKPSIDELCRVIENVSKTENLRLTDAAKKLVAELAQGDFRRLMFLLQNFSNIRNIVVDSNDIYEYYDVIMKKTLDLNSFDVTNKIFQRQTTLEEILKLYDTDKSLLPMMIHENYINVVNSQNAYNKEKMINCLNCIDSVINGDLIEKSMYNTQSWYLQPIHGLCSCYIPSHYSNTYPKLAFHGAKWTTTLGRFSLQRANIKNINLLSSMLNSGRSYTVDEIQLLSQIILYNLLDPKGNVSTGVSYLKNYNLTIQDIEKLIKVDKLSDKYKKLYTSRRKTQMVRTFGKMTQKEITPISYTITKNVTKFPSSGTSKTSRSKKVKKVIEDADADADADEEADDDDDDEPNDDDNGGGGGGDDINEEGDFDEYLL
jgi:replication factor C subunit 1